MTEIVTAQELGDRLKVPPSTVMGWYREGRIPGHRISHKVVRFDLTAVAKALGLDGAKRPAKAR
jgi:predicted site-specific integrase-resolvase